MSCSFELQGEYVMNKMEKQLIELEQYTVVEASIECTKCLKGDYLDAMDAERDAYLGGWRVHRGRCYCPECVKKLKIKP